MSPKRSRASSTGDSLPEPRSLRRFINVNPNTQADMIKREPQWAKENLDGTTTVSGKCVFTGEEYSCTVPTEGLRRFLDGEHAQTALSTVPADDREFLISGISPKGWSNSFGRS